MWTIGWGHTPSFEGQTITQEVADQLLLDDLGGVEIAINAAVEVVLNTNQFSALVDFAYNVGVEAFEDSTLLRYINEKDFEAAADEFGRWVYAGVEELQGLVIRRKAERKLFLTPVS